MTCMTCSADLSWADDEFSFCPYCGAPLDPDFGDSGNVPDDVESGS